jgi:hypothetical protein
VRGRSKANKGRHRKRTNPNIPAKGVLRKHADRLWSLAVRDDWAGKCAVCGNRKCEAHHLIPRQHETTRYSLRNGIALCANCHNFDPDTAPHQNAAGWLQWLSKHFPELHLWYTTTVANNGHKAFSGTTNESYFCAMIRGLQEYVPEEDFERIVGIRFARWLAESG